MDGTIPLLVTFYDETPPSVVLIRNKQCK